MFEEGSTLEYRIGVFGLPSAGKTSLIHKLCNYYDDNLDPTMNEEQYTMIIQNYFIYFWDFPKHILTPKSAPDHLIGFGGLLFVFNILDDISLVREFFESMIQVEALQNIPLLLIGTKFDLVPEEDQQIYNPSPIMNNITIHFKKTQCIFVSSQTGQGLDEIVEWIQKRAISLDVCENQVFENIQPSSVTSS